jgi:hypothetical protein
MEEIKKQIENTVYWIRVDQKKMYVLAKGNSKKETKKMVEEIVKGENINWDPEISSKKIFDDQEYALINRLIIKFHDDKKVYNHGVMSFRINNYQVLNKKLKKISRDNKDGYLWFEREWLLKNGWNKKYISNTLQLLRKNKGKILIPAINLYQIFCYNS